MASRKRQDYRHLPHFDKSNKSGQYQNKPNCWSGISSTHHKVNEWVILLELILIPWWCNRPLHFSPIFSTLLIQRKKTFYTDFLTLIT